MALVWKFRIFAGTHVGIILLVNLLFPLSLASWTFFLAAPFGKSPQLAAITSVLVSFIFAILALVLKGAGNGLTFIFTILFPSGFYIFVIRAICGFENRQIPTSVVRADPDNNLRVIFPVIAAIVCSPALKLSRQLTQVIPRSTYFSGHTSLCCSNVNYTTLLIHWVVHGTERGNPTAQKAPRCPQIQPFPSETWARISSHCYFRGKSLLLQLRTYLSMSRRTGSSFCLDPMGIKIIQNTQLRLAKLPSDTVPENPPHYQSWAACSAIRVVASCSKGATLFRLAVPSELFHRRMSYSPT